MELLCDTSLRVECLGQSPLDLISRGRVRSVLHVQGFFIVSEWGSYGERCPYFFSDASGSSVLSLSGREVLVSSATQRPIDLFSDQLLGSTKWRSDLDNHR